MQFLSIIIGLVLSSSLLMAQSAPSCEGVWQCAEECNHSGVKYYIKKSKESLNDNNPENGYTALHYAAEKGCDSVSGLLVTYKDVNLNAKTKEGKTPLMLAAASNFPKVVNQLIAKKAEIDLKDDKEYTAFAYAVEKGNESIALKLKENGADIISFDKEDDTLFIRLLKQHKILEAKMLLKMGFNINYRHELGNTALMYFALMPVTKRKEIGTYSKEVTFLLDSGADPYISEKVSGMNAAQLSVMGGDPSIVVIFKNYGVKDFNLPESFDKNFMRAVTDGNYYLIRAYDESGFDLNYRNDLGQTALIALANSEKWKENIAYFLLSKGVDPNIVDESGETALHYSVNNNLNDYIKLLCHFHAEVDKKTSDGLTPLMIAGMIGYFTIVKTLVEECNANVNVRFHNGNRASDGASNAGHEDIARYLRAREN